MSAQADLLQEMGIAFQYVEEFPIDQIVLNHAEMQVRDVSHLAPKKRVDEYANQMEAGAEFPPTVIDKSTSEVVDGNTRLGARKKLVKKGKSEPVIAALVAEFPTLVLRKLYAGRINQTGGERLSQGEARNLAMLLLSEGWEADSISLQIGVSEAEAKKWADELSARGRADGALTAKQVGFLTPAHWARANNIQSNSVMVEYLKLMADTGYSTGRASKLVTVLNKKGRSDKENLEFLKELRNEEATLILQRRSGQIRNIRPSATAAIGLAANVLAKRTKADYVQELNGNVSAEIVQKLRWINAFTAELIEEIKS